jgi:glycosyltransferase involved in cell wall biosynthesis
VVIADNTDQPELFIDPAKISAENVRYVINEGNLGYARNINKLILLADGEYVWLLSDDDIVQPDAVKEIYGALVSHEDKNINYLTFFSGNFKENEPAEDIYFNGCERDYFESGKDFLKSYWKSVIFVSLNVFHRRRVIEFAKENKLFDCVNDVFQNSLLLISFIDQFGHVFIISKVLLLTNCADKLYAPFHSVSVPILNYTKLLCQLRRLSLSAETSREMKKDIDMSIMFNALRFAVRRIETPDSFNYAAEYRRLLFWKDVFLTTKLKVFVSMLILMMPRALSRLSVKLILILKGKSIFYKEWKEASCHWYHRLYSEKVKVSY